MAADMLSRTADNLYWLARYVERAEYPRAHPRGDAAPDPLPLAYVGRATNEIGGRDRRLRPAPSPPYPEANEETVTSFCASPRRQSVLDPQLLRDRAHQCARGAHRAHRGDVGRHQRHLAQAQALRQRPDLARGVACASCAGCSLAALRRLGLPHHAAQRRLLVLAARRLSRARRQHRAHPRRQVPSAAAGPHERSAGRSIISNGRRSCARSRRSPPITGSIARASSRG